MNKELRELLGQINNMKTNAKKLVNDGKLEDAKAMKNDIAELERKK